MDKVRTMLLDNTNKQQIIDILEQEMTLIFNCTVDSLPDNYSHTKSWGLLNLITNGDLDCYMLIWVNDKFWSGSGGKVRTYNGEIVYQGGFRSIANNGDRHSGLGVKPYSHQYSTKYQIERAKHLGCEKFILSFNEYNKRLFELHSKYHVPRAFGADHKFVPSETPIMFNGVPQWLLTMSLK